jgi:SulP family sulfate permease
VKTFGQIRRQLGARGITLPVEAVLRRAGELTDSPLLKLYRTDADALAALGQPVAVPADLAAAAF